MQKRLINMEKRFGKATLALLFLSVLTLAVMITPVARAQGGETMTLSPSQGPPGTLVQLTITGFPEFTPVTFMFGTINLGQVTPSSLQYSTVFNVPGVSDGTFTVTATSALGGFDFASTTFIVGSAATPAPPTVSPSVTPSRTYSPSGTPIQPFQTSPPVTVSSGFWSPLTIALTAVVVAFVIFVTAVYLRRGKQKPLSYEEESRYEPRPSTPSNTPYAPSSTNQPATSTSYQPYSSSRTATSTSYHLTHPQGLINHQLTVHTRLIHRRGIISRELAGHRRLVQGHAHIANELSEMM